jgi:hypothetical protein
MDSYYIVQTDSYYIVQLELQPDLKAFPCNCFKLRRPRTFRKIKNSRINVWSSYVFDYYRISRRIYN